MQGSLLGTSLGRDMRKGASVTAKKDGKSTKETGKTETIVAKRSFKDEVKGFVLGKDGKLDMDAVGSLKDGLAEVGFLLFHEETLVRKIAGMRLVPGNEVRVLVDALKKGKL